MNKNRLLPQVKSLIYNYLLLSQVSYCYHVHFSEKKVVRIKGNLPYNAHTEYYFTNFYIINIINLSYYRLSLVYRDAVIKCNTWLLNTIPLNVRTPSYQSKKKWMTSKLKTYWDQSLIFQLPVPLNNVINLTLVPSAFPINHFGHFFSKPPCPCK